MTQDRRPVPARRIAGAHAGAVYDELVGLSPRSTEVQLDEKGSFVRTGGGLMGLMTSDDDPAYATETRRREKGRAVEVGTRAVFGTTATVQAAPGMSKVGRAVNTAFVRRENGADRRRNARKARKTHRFSEGWRRHEAVTYLSINRYNV